MSKPALQLVGAVLEQAPTTLDVATTTPSLTSIQVEAAWLGGLAASFGLFGAKLEHDEPQGSEEHAIWPKAGAQAAYLAEEVTPLEPANESASPDPSPLEMVNVGEPVTAFVADIVAASALLKTAPTRASFPEIKPQRFRLSPAYAMRLMQAIDWVVIIAAAQLAAMWGNGYGLAALTLAQAGAFLLAAGALKAGLWLSDVYRTPPAKLRAEHGAGGLALGVVAGLALASFTAPDARSAAALSALLPLAALLMAGVHAAFALWIGALHRHGAFSETIVLVGATEAAGRLAQRAAERGDARVVAIVDDRLARAPFQLGGFPVTGSIDELLNWEGLPHVDRIVITVTQKAETRVRAIIEKLRVAPNRIDLLLDYETFAVRGRRLDRLTGAAMACVSGRPHHAGRAILKRAQDVIIGAALLVMFAPLMALIALGVKLDSAGPAIYRQRRHGFNNHVITILKFRSMRHDVPEGPLRQVEPNDPRITRIGRFLRRTSLDELPQLINVLRGEMSLVGPRPHAVGMRAADRDLTHIVAEYAHRHQVKPGITGWAQVNGSRGPIDTPASVRNRVKLDLDYVSRASLWLDLAILVRTAPALFGDKATR